jgi:PEGA domain
MKSGRQILVSVIMGVGTLAGLGGCVERKLTIGSAPEGALVMVNDVEVGRTPVTVPFLWYGNYDLRFRLEKNVAPPGEPPQIRRWYLHTHKQTQIPWYEIFGIDLFAELLPVQLKDEQVWAFDVPEVKSDPDAEVIQRAQELKGELDKEQSRDKK